MKTRSNDYPGVCRKCGRHIDAGKGLLMKPPIPARVAKAAARRPVPWRLWLFCKVCVPQPQP